MDIVVRKSAFRIDNQIKFKLACRATETSKNINILHVASLVIKPSRVSNNGVDQTAQMCRLVETSTLHNKT